MYQQRTKSLKAKKYQSRDATLNALPDVIGILLIYKSINYEKSIKKIIPKIIL